MALTALLALAVLCAAECPCEFTLDTENEQRYVETDARDLQAQLNDAQLAALYDIKESLYAAFLRHHDNATTWPGVRTLVTVLGCYEGAFGGGETRILQALDAVALREVANK